MRSSFRLVSFSLFVLGVAGLAACGSDSMGPDHSAVAGTYTLQTANGLSLPVDLVEGGEPFTLHSGNIVLRADGTCTNTFVTTPSRAGSLPCTFTLSGTTFSYNELGDVINGSLSGNTLTLTNDGNNLVYTR